MKGWLYNWGLCFLVFMNIGVGFFVFYKDRLVKVLWDGVNFFFCGYFRKENWFWLDLVDLD